MIFGSSVIIVWVVSLLMLSEKNLMPSIKVAVALFCPEYTQFEPSMLVGNGLLPVELKESSSAPVSIFLRPKSQNSPLWGDLIKEISDTTAHDISTATSGAIIFVEIDNRVVSFCYGTSVANINKDMIEDDFGLSVAFYEVSKSAVKNVGTLRISSNPTENSTQSAMPMRQEDFPIDRFFDNLTDLEGFVYKGGRRKVKGKQFYSDNSPLSTEDIIERSRDLVTHYNQSQSNPLFQRLISVRKVKDKATKDALDNILVNSINKRKESVNLVDYESIEGQNCYKLTPKGKTYENLTIEDIYKHLEGRRIGNSGALKTRRIYLETNSGEYLGEWNFYKCLFASISEANDEYVLYKGTWYSIRKEFIKSLRANIDEVEVLLPDGTAWDKVCNEDAFNEKLAGELNGQNWDKKLYTRPDYPYGIEFCDVLTADRIIHVKKYKSSSLTSHLLNQTTVSARLLKEDPDMLKWLGKKSKVDFGKNIITSQGKLKNARPKYTILFMTGKSKKVSKTLPFFSLVALNITIQNIHQLGYDVEVARL